MSNLCITDCLLDQAQLQNVSQNRKVKVCLTCYRECSKEFQATIYTYAAFHLKSKLTMYLLTIKLLRHFSMKLDIIVNYWPY